jgi:hypothetical protein
MFPIVLVTVLARCANPILLRQSLWKETRFKYPDPKEGPEELSLSSK